MTEVRIIFDGSMAIGPAYPPNLKTLGPLFAVLPHAPRQQTRRSRGSTPQYIPAHAPGIFTNMISVKETRPPDLKYSHYYLWYPLRERMEVAIDGYADPGYLYYKHDPRYDESQANTSKTDDIAAISDMRQIWPARRRLRPGMLAREGYVSPAVGAQVFVPSGDVSSDSIYPRYDGQPEEKKYEIQVEFIPRKTQDTLKKRILPQVVVKLQVDAYVELLMSSLDTGAELDLIRFNLADQPPGVKYDIWIVNGDPDNFRYVIDQLEKPPEAGYEGAVPNAGGANSGPIPATDFELVYSVLGGPDYGGLPIPFVAPLGQRPCYTAMVEPDESSG